MINTNTNWTPRYAENLKVLFEIACARMENLTSLVTDDGRRDGRADGLTDTFHCINGRTTAISNQCTLQ